MSLFRLRLSRRGSLFFAGNAGSQPFSSPGSTTGQNFATPFGSHPGPEAVVIHLFSVRRLKRSFHISLTLNYNRAFKYKKISASVKVINSGNA